MFNTFFNEMNSFSISSEENFIIVCRSDKCICGTMVGSGKKARCHLNLEMDPDDDKVKVNCYELSKFEMDGHTVHVGKDL